jgi:hypothetical protein
MSRNPPMDYQQRLNLLDKESNRAIIRDQFPLAARDDREIAKRWVQMMAWDLFTLATLLGLDCEQPGIFAVIRNALMYADEKSDHAWITNSIIEPWIMITRVVWLAALKERGAYSNYDYYLRQQQANSPKETAPAAIVTTTNPQDELDIIIKHLLDEHRSLANVFKDLTSTLGWIKERTLRICQRARTIGIDPGQEWVFKKLHLAYVDVLALHTKLPPDRMNDFIHEGIGLSTPTADTQAIPPELREMDKKPELDKQQVLLYFIDHTFQPPYPEGAFDGQDTTAPYLKECCDKIIVFAKMLGIDVTKVQRAIENDILGGMMERMIERNAADLFGETALRAIIAGSLSLAINAERGTAQQAAQGWESFAYGREEMPTAPPPGFEHPSRPSRFAQSVSGDPGYRFPNRPVFDTQPRHFGEEGTFADQRHAYGWRRGELPVGGGFGGGDFTYGYGRSWGAMDPSVRYRSNNDLPGEWGRIPQADELPGQRPVYLVEFNQRVDLIYGAVQELRGLFDYHHRQMNTHIHTVLDQMERRFHNHKKEMQREIGQLREKVAVLEATTIPSCDCGFLYGDGNVGMTCPQCNTVVCLPHLRPVSEKPSNDGVSGD